MLAYFKFYREAWLAYFATRGQKFNFQLDAQYGFAVVWQTKWDFGFPDHEIRSISLSFFGKKQKKPQFFYSFEWKVRLDIKKVSN